MNKKINITKSLILSFLAISVFAIFIISIICVVYSKINEREYSYAAYAIISLISYKYLIPYAIALSVYLSFFKGKYLDDVSLSKIITIPIVSVIALVLFYALYDYFLLDKLTHEFVERENYKDYRVFLKYELDLKNKTYENAKEELLKGNLDNSYKLARKALFYEGDNGNILLLLKSIRKEMEELNETQNRSEIRNIDNLMRRGVLAFSSHDYETAARYFNEVLELESGNTLSLYYLNRISLAQNDKPKYLGGTSEEIYAYGKLAEIISLYESGRLWKAYEEISSLYAEVPNISEVNNYYSIITDAINSYDFFIEEASEIKKVFIDDNDYSINNPILDSKALNLSLDDNTLLSSLNSVYFKGNLYMFDVSVIKTDDFQITDKKNYMYGKLADSFYSNTNGTKNIILKVPFDENKKDYIYSDTNHLTIPISISASTVEGIKSYDELTFDYMSLPKLLTLREELPRFGYSNFPVNLKILKRAVYPAAYLLLFIIIAYYSFKFREELSYKAASTKTKFIGLIGTLLLTATYGILLDYICSALVNLPSIIGIASVYVLVASIIPFILLQISRIPKNVK